jgi:hypothetical protein
LQKIEKSAKRREFCMGQSNAFLQLAKGVPICFKAIAKGDKKTFSVCRIHKLHAALIMLAIYCWKKKW